MVTTMTTADGVIRWVPDTVHEAEAHVIRYVMLAPDARSI